MNPPGARSTRAVTPGSALRVSAVLASLAALLGVVSVDSVGLDERFAHAMLLLGVVASANGVALVALFLVATPRVRRRPAAAPRGGGGWAVLPVLAVGVAGPMLGKFVRSSAAGAALLSLVLSLLASLMIWAAAEIRWRQREQPSVRQGGRFHRAPRSDGDRGLDAAEREGMSD